MGTFWPVGVPHRCLVITGVGQANCCDDNRQSYTYPVPSEICL